jgi:hypothetical protein
VISILVGLTGVYPLSRGLIIAAAVEAIRKIIQQSEHRDEVKIVPYRSELCTDPSLENEVRDETSCNKWKVE